MTTPAEPNPEVGATRIRPGGVRAFIFCMVTLLSLAFVATMFFERHEQAEPYYAPRGYYDRVEDMLQTGALHYRTGGAQPWGRLQYVPANATPSQQVFFDNAPRLIGDLRRFNETGRGLFELATTADGGRVPKVNRFTYNYSLPYPKEQRADPEISFAGEDLPSMSNTLVSLRFERRDDEETIASGDYVRLPIRRWLGDSGDQEGTTYRSLGYELLDRRGGSLIHLRSEKDGINLECVSERVTVTINGVSLNSKLERQEDDIAKLDRPVGQRPNNYRLRVGDRIRIVEGAEETTFRFGRFENARISRNWKDSSFGEEFASRFPYGAQLASNVRYFVQYSDLPGLNLNPRINLTVDLQLHGAVEEKLVGFVQRLDGGLRHTQPYLPKQPAAVSIVDALNGDVLAVASYPTPEVLDKLLDRRKFVSASEGRALGLNQNFVHVPVGSTTKPLFACAAWQANPQLMDLVVVENSMAAGGMPGVYGHSFPKSRPAFTYFGSSPRTITARDFLKKSSNAYTISLYFASMLDPDSYRVSGGRPVPVGGGRLDFSKVLAGDEIRGGLLSKKIPANQILEDEFDVMLTRDRLSDSGLRFDLEFVQPLLDELGADVDTVPQSFWTVTPRLTNFELSRVRSARNELVSLLVGGHTNWWSNLKLAEAIARVGSGNRVELRMFKRPGDEEMQPEFEPLDLRPEVLDLVQAGMGAAIAEPGGTARRLYPTFLAEAQRRAAEMGLRYEIIGKTGTASRQAHGERIPRDCAAFVFYLSLKDAAGEVVSATSTAIYLQDRNKSRHAVDLAKEFLPELMRHMEDQAKRR